VLNEELFEQQMQNNARIVKKILKNMSARLRDANKQIENLLIRDANSRVAHTLLQLAHKHGGKNATDIKQHLALLQHEKVLALDTALRDDPRYMADLEEEILATRHAYVGSAVIEIAHLRAVLGGENWG